MFCSILPYSRSFDDGLLTYHIPDEYKPFVSIGSSVRIPWWDGEALGIVASMSPDMHYEGDIKSILWPHSSVAWLSASEIALIVWLARHLFVRIHTLVQIFLPLGLIALFEKNNFLDLTTPVVPDGRGERTYTVAPDEVSLMDYLEKKLRETPGVVILPEGVSVKWWSRIFPDSLIDTHSKSLSTQKRVYLDLLTQKYPVVFGTRRTLLKRLWWYKHIYIIHETLSPDINFGRRKIPLWMMTDFLEAHGHIIHFVSLTPSIRTLTHFLQQKKTPEYL